VPTVNISDTKLDATSIFIVFFVAFFENSYRLLLKVGATMGNSEAVEGLSWGQQGGERKVTSELQGHPVNSRSRGALPSVPDVEPSNKSRNRRERENGGSRLTRF
jgi:hypothetical protein